MTKHTSRMMATTFACVALAGAAGAQAGPLPGAAPRAAGAGAPQAAGRITGTVINARTSQPMDAAGVAIRNATDSALVGGGFTRADGSFRVDGLRPGLYTVRVRVLGFAPVIKSDVRVTPASPALDVGRILLTPVATELSAVAVTSERSDVALAPDRNSYVVKDMPSAAGGSAVDVLRNVPAIEVDGDNKVSLRGNENVVVQINGRISPMRGDQLGNFLAQLPSNMVASVEVVPNPSAKNDPEGMAGIINIVLKENTDLGLSGGVTAGGGSTGQINASGNLGYQRGALTLFVNYGYMQDKRAISGFSNRAGLVSGLLPFLESDISGAFVPKSHSLNASADYQIAPRNVLSSNLIVSKRDLTRNNTNSYRELDAARVLTSRSLRSSAQSNDDLTLDYALSYKRTAEQQGDGLVTELRVNRSRGDGNVLLTDRALGLTAAAPAGTAALETDATGDLTRNWTLQTDFTHSFAGRTKLETGYKGTLRQLENQFDVANFSDVLNAYVPDLGRSNAFDYDEQVHAAYAVVSKGAGKFDLQAGLRAEQAVTRFDLATTSERFDNSYRSLYPSALATYNVDDTRQLKVSYSKRVTRPDTRQLNPFGFREDALNVFRGNPGLKPEYTHAFELGYQQSFTKGTLQITPFARHTVNAVRFIRTIDDAGVATTTFQNVATSDSYGADVNGSVRFGRLSGFGGFSAFKQVTDGSNLNTDVSNNSFGWSARTNATVKVTPTLDVQGFLMYRAPMTTEQGRMSAMTMTNLAVRQKLLGDQASVSLRVMDPFQLMGFGFKTDDGRFAQSTRRNFNARGAFLTFSYTFGQQPRIRSRPSEQPETSQPATDGQGA
ncbi:MAG: TonB-dependent receptor [Gemmatimonadetes bacterium]|nr:TonB-dependent receptor [Gemmatimonadota bacterium]